MLLTEVNRPARSAFIGARGKNGALAKTPASTEQKRNQNDCLKLHTC